ncbi:unnamed protein product, partial [Sphacelaria rigidula]
MQREPSTVTNGKSAPPLSFHADRNDCLMPPVDEGNKGFHPLPTASRRHIPSRRQQHYPTPSVLQPPRPITDRCLGSCIAASDRLGILLVHPLHISPPRVHFFARFSVCCFFSVSLSAGQCLHRVVLQFCSLPFG